ncbi:MAG: hypothetical protein OHK93_006529 [Ramalina farinacea]|uniref:Uncharacterized protein n=1 Tax=Ramalina farinacea TaxID=258253 RepID=A0AA43TUN0_9LECA|nr:hypothetical protein [Ramalina farinacea]
MDETKAAVFPLSPIDMLMPRMHVLKLLYFASTAEPAAILSNLRAALSLTIDTMPMIAGSVTLSERQEDQKGFLNVQSPYFTAEDIISFNDLRNKYDYEQLRAAHFPSNGVAFDAIAPKSFGQAGDSAPVMVAQANILRGGLLLFFAVHHCVFDEIGIFNIMKVWSSCCRGDVGNDFVTPQWFDRGPLSHGEGPGRLEDHPEYTLSLEGTTARAIEDASAFYPKSADVATAVLFLSDHALESLKRATTIPGPNAGLSTNDALIALFWCCITSTRCAERAGATEKVFSRFGTAVNALITLFWCCITFTRCAERAGAREEVFSRFAMAVNGRSHMRPPMSPDYCGNVVLIAKTSSRVNDLLGQQSGRLTKAALLVRQSVKAVEDAYIKDVVQMVRNVDVNRLAPRRRPAVEYSLGCSTWARQPYYSLDWGSTVGGSCERVRGRRLQTDGLFIIYPRLHSTEGLSSASQGGLEVQLGLKSDHLERLKKDPLFGEYVEWRCD